MHIIIHTANGPSLLATVFMRVDSQLLRCVYANFSLLLLLLHRYACMYALSAAVLLWAYSLVVVVVVIMRLLFVVATASATFTLTLTRLCVCVCLCVVLLSIWVFVGTQPFARRVGANLWRLPMYFIICIRMYAHIWGCANKCLHVCIRIYVASSVLVCFPCAFKSTQVCVCVRVLVFGLQLTSFPLS